MHQSNFNKTKQKRMKTKYIHIICFSLALLMSFHSLAQEQIVNDSLDPQLVRVVKPYSPKISDAFKLKQLPSLENQEILNKKSINYTIFSFPVASIFTPAKSKSIGLEQLKKERKFSNVAALSVGNYTNINGDLFLNKSITKGRLISAYLSHQSSQGGIKDLFLDDLFSENTAQLKYNVTQGNKNWNVRAAAQRYMSHWYGLSTNVDTAPTESFDTKQIVSVFQISGSLSLNQGLVEGAEVEAYTLSDDYDSNESRAQFKTQLKLDVLDKSLETQFGLSFLKGSFKEGFAANQALDYGNLGVSISPKFKFNLSSFDITAGLKVVYIDDNERSKQTLHVYPKITTSYDVVDSIFIAYAGIEGDLDQNTYRDLYLENPFIAPTLNILPTSMPYKLFVGSKGRLANSISYDASAVFSRQNDAVLFQKNGIQSNLNNQPFGYGNSFGVVYDDMETLTVQGSLFFQFNNSLNITTKASFSSYGLDNEEEAWNLPKIQASLEMRYQPTNRLNLGFQGYYFGKRFDLHKTDISQENQSPQTTALDAFIDLNIDASYSLTPKWSLTLKLNNILGRNYHRWMDFPAQGAQVSAGAFYKFDF